MTSSVKRVAVVGGGLAGLTAAYRMSTAGVQAVVLEQAPLVGGRASTDEVDGYRVDGGAQLFGSMYERLFALVEELGLRDRLVRSPGRDALWRGGRAHEVVYGSVSSMLVSGALPLRLKLRLGASYLPFLERHADVLEIGGLERAAEAGLDEESVEEWGTRELGRDFVDYLAHPQLAAYYGATPAQTTAALYHMLARYGTGISVHTLRHGVGELAEALAAAVERAGGEVRRGAAVERVEEDGIGARVQLAEGTETFDGVLLAVPAPAARRLLAGGRPLLDEWLAAVRYAPSLSLALLLERPVGVGYFGLSFPPGESRSLAALCVEENKGGGLVPAGRGLVVVLPSPRAAAELLESDSRSVLDVLLPEVLRVWPGLDRAVARARVYRWPNGNPVFYPGYLRHLASFRGGALEAGAPLALAGDYLSTPTAEGAVLSGERAARRLLERLAAAG